MALIGIFRLFLGSSEGGLAEQPNTCPDIANREPTNLYSEIQVFDDNRVSWVGEAKCAHDDPDIIISLDDEAGTAWCRRPNYMRFPAKALSIRILIVLLAL